mgnify:CR=1 FL=1
MKLSKSTLGDISKDGRGYYGIAASAVPFSSCLYTYLRITDINDDGTLNATDLKSVADDDAMHYLLKPNDIVFARTGASTGRNYFYDGTDGELVYAGFLIKFSIDPQKVNPRFVKYYCQSKTYYDWIESFNTGSTRGNINAQTLASMPIYLPEREYQDRVVSILDSIERKKRENSLINDNLQQQAMALYAEMFLNSSDNNVTSGTLSDIAVITMGQSPSGSSYNEDGVGEVFYQGRAEFGFRFPKRRLFTTEPKRMAETGDVLLSVRAPVGDLNVAYERCCIGRGLGAIHSKTGHSSFVLYTMFALRSQLDVFNGEGTVFGSINRDALNAIPIDIPPVTGIDQFEVVAHPIDELIRANYEENCRLEAIRDSLLPKLMSGEIDVSAVQP